WAVVKLMVGLLLLGVVGNLAHQIRDVLVWTAAALFLAVALNPLVARLEPRLGRTAAALVVFLGFVVLLIATLAALVAPFVTQVDQRERAVAIAQHANRQVGGYVFGNLVISVICGTVTWLSLYVLGVPYSLALAVFMAVFDIIPLVGATVGSIVVIGAAFLLTGTTAGIAM